MQSLSILIVESQTAKRRLLRMFDSLDDCGSQLERNGVVQGCEKRRLFQSIRRGAIRFEVVGINRALLQ
jgi:hypothetical protein